MPVADIPQVTRDPKDDKFLATATAGEAGYLVSEDPDLLDLRASRNQDRGCRYVSEDLG
jgi:predicted nucleic acid-binding protein